jgi:hypothetical protein
VPINIIIIITLDIMTAIRYAHGSGETPGVLVMLDGRSFTQSLSEGEFGGTSSTE